MFFFFFIARAKSCFTLVLHYGGKFVACNGNARYEGGKVKKWDYYLIKNMSVGLVKVYCEELGILKLRKIHVQIEDGWIFIASNSDLKKAYHEYVKDREFHL